MVDLEKSRQAGIIAQSALIYVIRQLHQNIGEVTIGEICRRGDKFILEHTARSYKTVTEKGIALPTQICKNDVVDNFAPELSDSDQGGIVAHGDVVKVALGVHIDGYTSQLAHTVVIREDQPVTGPFGGPDADACVGAYLAIEAVIAALSSVLSSSHPLASTTITGTLLRNIVDSVADSFDLCIVPGSRIRRTRRFVAGQPTVMDSLEAVVWPTPEDTEDFEVRPDTEWLVDIAFASKNEEKGELKVIDARPEGSFSDQPAIYCRDHSVTYNLRTKAARSLLSRGSTVFPFKLSYLGDDFSHLRLGLVECLQRHLIVALRPQSAKFIPDNKLREAHPVTVAREMTTVVLVSGHKTTSGFPEAIRLGGGSKQLPPSWLHSQYEVSGVAAEILSASSAGHQAVKYIQVTGNLKAIEPTAKTGPAENMEIEV